MRETYLQRWGEKLKSKSPALQVYILSEGEKRLCNHPKRKYAGYGKDDIIKGTLPNNEIMKAYISTQYKNVKGRKQIKTNIKEIM
jgi:hypothetical protein